MNLAIELLALCLYGPLVVLLHEAGHAALARAGGYRLTSFGVGLGRPLFRVQTSRGSVIYLGRWVLLGGACHAIPIGHPSWRRAWFHGGGLLVQVALALLLVVLPQVWLVERLATFNALVLLTNALPWRVGGTASDGWQLLQLLRGPRASSSLLPPRSALQAIAERERAAGSPLGTAHADLCLAWADLRAGRPREAARHFEEDPSALALEPWLDALHHYLRSEWCRQEGRPLGAVQVARQARAQLVNSAPEEASALLDLAEARALVDLEAPAGARKALSRLVGVGGPIGRQAAVVQLAATLDEAADELEHAAWRVMRRLDGAWLDPADAAATLWRAGEALDAHGRPAAGRALKEAARALARRTLKACEGADRPSLLRRMGGAADPSGMPDHLEEARRP